jgi:dTDP-4-dehydrorhamnose 3,5-epimerase-like enzyme
MITDITNVEIKEFKPFLDEKGCLVPIEFDRFPFIPVRLFWVTDVPKGGVRGNHAHLTTCQIIICVKGIIEVNLYNGVETKVLSIREHESVYIKNFVWDSQKFIEEGSIIIVLCSTPYTPGDYITDMDAFKRIANGSRE